MKWTAMDEQALEACRKCIETCRGYHILPQPYFPLAVRMYEELERAGMIEREEATENEVYETAVG